MIQTPTKHNTIMVQIPIQTHDTNMIQTPIQTHNTNMIQTPIQTHNTGTKHYQDVQEQAEQGIRNTADSKCDTFLFFINVRSNLIGGQLCKN